MTKGNKKETKPPEKTLTPEANKDPNAKLEKRLRIEFIMKLSGLEKKTAYLRGLAVGAEAGDDIIAAIDGLDAEIEQIKK